MKTRIKGNRLYGRKIAAIRKARSDHIRTKLPVKPRCEAAFLDGGRRSNEESGFCGHALASRLVPRRNHCDRAQNRQGVNRNRGRTTVDRNANCAATGAIRRGRVNVSRFQPAKDEHQQYAAQGNPAPEPARRELSSMDDTSTCYFRILGI
jgi:hypothetical protein